MNDNLNWESVVKIRIRNMPQNTQSIQNYAVIMIKLINKHYFNDNAVRRTVSVRLNSRHYMCLKKTAYLRS